MRYVIGQIGNGANVLCYCGDWQIIRKSIYSLSVCACAFYSELHTNWPARPILSELKRLVGKRDDSPLLKVTDRFRQSVPRIKSFVRKIINKFPFWPPDRCQKPALIVKRDEFPFHSVRVTDRLTRGDNRRQKPNLDRERRWISTLIDNPGPMSIKSPQFEDLKRLGVSRSERCS